MMDKQYLYAVRDLDSGKLVSNITNPSRKYWDKRGNAESAVRTQMNRTIKRGGHYHLAVVQFELVPIGEYEVR